MKMIWIFQTDKNDNRLQKIKSKIQIHKKYLWNFWHNLKSIVNIIKNKKLLRIQNLTKQKSEGETIPILLKKKQLDFFFEVIQTSR